jgi:hypothetical protein
LNMLIEEAVLIKADMGVIWRTFTDLTRWCTWNTVACDVASESGRIAEGERLQFSLRFFSIPIEVKLDIEEVVPGERIVWGGSKFGISSRHEFLFQQVANGVLVTSREAFRGLPLLFGNKSFPENEVRELTDGMLKELKRAAERRDT